MSLKIKELKKKVLELINSIIGNGIGGIGTKYDGITQEIYIDKFIDVLAKENIKSRENYVENYQNALIEVMNLLFGNSVSFPECLKNNLKENGELIVQAFMKDNLQTYPIRQESHTYDVISDIIDESIKEMEINAGTKVYSSEEMFTMKLDIVNLLESILISHPNYLLTLLSNMDTIAESHYPEICLSWLMSVDENYKYFVKNEDDEQEEETRSKWRFINPICRPFTIACPVDVTVYDSKGNKVAEIINDEPQEIEGSSIIATINEDGEKVVYLPTNESYTVILNATDNGTMSCFLNEYSYTTNTDVRKINYYDIKIQKGDEFICQVPKYEGNWQDDFSQGTNLEYILTNETTGEMLMPNDMFVGKDAENAVYNVEVDVNDENCGIVFGGGERSIGQYCKLTAIAKADSEFTGWYDENGNLLSKDTEFTVKGYKDIKIEARFVSTKKEETGDNDNSVAFEKESDQVVTVDTSIKPDKASEKEQSTKKQVVINKIKYRIDTKTKKAIVIGTTYKKIKKIVIPATITDSGIKYKVTVIKKNAFMTLKKLKKVTIGKNVTTIEKKAFYKCRKLSKVTVRSKKLKTVNKKAIYKCNKEVQFIVPKTKKKKYKKMLKGMEKVK